MNEPTIKKVSQFFFVTGMLPLIVLSGMIIISCIGFTLLESVWFYLMGSGLVCISVSGILKLFIKSERKDALKLSLFIFLVIIGFAAVMFLILAPVVHHQNAYKAMSEPFLSCVKEYVNSKGLVDDPNNYNPYIIGKVIIVDNVINDNNALEEEIWKPVIGIDDIERGPSQRINGCEYFKLPVELRAVTPDEVGTIIWLKWDSILEGRYGDHFAAPGANRILCEAVVIDKGKNVIIGRKSFRGGTPPSHTRFSSTSKYNTRYGFRPTAEIVDYITSLPRNSN